jgi:Htaa protein
MNHPVPHRRRAGALLATAGLAAAGLVALTGPADAAVPTLATAASGSFDWKVSTTFDTSFATHELTGTTETEAGVVSFPATWSTVDPATGEGTVQYDGAVKGSFVVGGATQYWVKLEDPAVTVDAAGEGQITAEVSAWNVAGMGSPEASTTPARVVVTTFDAAGTWSTKSIAATPDWAGVLPADSPQADALAIPDGQPVDGKSFAATFLGQITSGVRARFYASGSVTDANKAPAPFTASYADVAKTVTTSTTYAAQQATIKVDGTGFIPADKPGDNGVYVGLAPAGGLPDVTSQAAMSAFAASQWVPASAIRNSAFSTTLTVAGSKLDKTKSYAVYTWRAHARSSASQDSQTAVTFDWAQLTAPPAPAKGTTTVTAKVTKKPTTKKGGTLKVSLTSTGAAPTGKVTVKLTRTGAKAVNRAAAIKSGKAVMKLPRLKAGTWKATIAYAGTDTLEGSTKTVKLTVKAPKKATKR